MKTFKLLALAGVFASITSYQVLKEENIIKDTGLGTIEALALIENDKDTENKYTYQYPYGEKCLIYVGGAYATGKKVDCFFGYDHPICVDCAL